MENYTITKEQILETIRTGTDVTERYFKEIIPEALKKELEIGKWYKTKKEGFEKCLFNLLGKMDTCIIYYGFNAQGSWSSKTYWFTCYKTMEFLEATPEEVEVALKAETIKRYGKDWENTKIKAHADGQPWIGNGLNKGFFSCGLTPNEVFSKHGVLYSHGNWAQILPQEKTVVPMDKALKIIAKKMKVSPENIEIQS